MNFKQYFEYYQNLRETPSKEYLEMGEFGKSCWDDNICEGLITSYPQEKVIEFIQNLKTGDDFEISKNYDTQLIKIFIEPITNSIDNIVNKLNNDLKLFGYNVGRQFNPNHFGQYPVLIEPLHTGKVDVATIGQLYHITHKKYLNKINKIGLSPRNSTTVFTHPGGRIYLFTINNEDNINVLKRELSSKRISSKYPNKELDNTPENMIVLEIIPPYTFELYEDPMFGGWQNFKGYFTTENISPDLLEIMS